MMAPAVLPVMARSRALFMLLMAPGRPCRAVWLTIRVIARVALPLNSCSRRGDGGEACHCHHS